MDLGLPLLNVSNDALRDPFRPPPREVPASDQEAVTITGVTVTPRDSWEDIRQELATWGGVKTFPMQRLRNAAGWGRLGHHVVKDIAEKMRAEGLSHLGDLPVRNKDHVRVYLAGSTIARLVEAIFLNTSEADFELQRLGKMADRMTLLRELICVE